MAGGALSLDLPTRQPLHFPSHDGPDDSPPARSPAKCADVGGTALSATRSAASADAEDGTARPPGGVREGRTEEEAAAT